MSDAAAVCKDAACWGTAVYHPEGLVLAGAAGFRQQQYDTVEQARSYEDMGRCSGILRALPHVLELVGQLTVLGQFGQDFDKFSSSALGSKRRHTHGRRYSLPNLISHCAI